jgi:hypothetical protein
LLFVPPLLLLLMLASAPLLFDFLDFVVDGFCGASRSWVAAHS